MTSLAIRTTVVILAWASAVSAQSLADVARKEEERRKAVATAGKVYTNERLQPAPSSTAAPASATPPAPAAAAPSVPPAGASADRTTPVDVAAAATDTPRTEDAWRKRMAIAREALSRSQIFADALQSRINGLTTEFENRDDPAQRSAVAADRQKALTELDRVKKEIEQQQKAIIAIQDEARRAGVPAGWTR